MIASPIVDEAWNFHAAFSVAAGVIPTLLLALVLEKQLLAVTVRGSHAMKKAVEDLPEWLKRAAGAVPTTALGLGLLQALFLPATVILVAILAEMLALTGVALPTSWMDAGVGHVISFVALVFIGCAILLLLVHIAVGLVYVAAHAEEADDTAPGDPSTPPGP